MQLRHVSLPTGESLELAEGEEVLGADFADGQTYHVLILQREATEA